MKAIEAVNSDEDVRYWIDELLITREQVDHIAKVAAAAVATLPDELEGPGDTEMLDWLIRQRRYVDYLDFDTEPGRYICLLVSDSHCTHLINDQNMFDTPREAIKSAMERTKNENLSK